MARCSEKTDLQQWLTMVDQLRLHAPFESMKQTHISVVLFNGDQVLKLKKPVDFGFLDYTTIDKRREACEAELRLNSRLCPEIYLGLQPITSDHGTPRLSGSGPVIDFGVLMKRLPEDRMLDVLVRCGTATEAIIDRVVKRLSDFHRVAGRGADVDAFGSLDQIRFNWNENFDQTAPFIGRTIRKESFDRIRAWVNLMLDQNSDRFAERVHQGCIIDGHGDTRCESVCVVNGIHIFDCIEFNDRFRCGDAASEIAFLAMDLDALGRPDLGYYAAEQYQTYSGDESLMQFLPFYRCYRAFVRGKVHSFSLDESEFPAAAKEEANKRASALFDLAERYASPLTHPTLVLVSGLAGTGKTTLARAIAGELGLVLISTDAVRRALMGDAKAPSSFGEGAYTTEARNLTYASVFEKAAGQLARGIGVVLDGTFLDEQHVSEARTLALHHQAEFRHIECALPDDAVRDRMMRRTALQEGLSDATYEIHQRQKALQPPQHLAPFRVDTQSSIVAAARSATGWLRSGESIPGNLN